MIPSVEQALVPYAEESEFAILLRVLEGNEATQVTQVTLMLRCI